MLKVNGNPRKYFWLSPYMKLDSTRKTLSHSQKPAWPGRKDFALQMCSRVNPVSVSCSSRTWQVVMSVWKLIT